MTLSVRVALGFIALFLIPIIVGIVVAFIAGGSTAKMSMWISFGVCLILVVIYLFRLFRTERDEV